MHIAIHGSWYPALDPEIKDLGRSNLWINKNQILTQQKVVSSKNVAFSHGCVFQFSSGTFLRVRQHASWRWFFSNLAKVPLPPAPIYPPRQPISNLGCWNNQENDGHAVFPFKFGMTRQTQKKSLALRCHQLAFRSRHAYTAQQVGPLLEACLAPWDRGVHTLASALAGDMAKICDSSMSLKCHLLSFGSVFLISSKDMRNISQYYLNLRLS